MKRWRILCVLIASAILSGCVSILSEPRELKIGTGSRIEVFNSHLTFRAETLPKGWVLEAEDPEELFHSSRQIPFIYHTVKGNQRSLFLQNHPDGYFLVRYTRAKLVVSPFMTWRWHVSEHSGVRHPVQLVVGFYGGKTDSPPVDLSGLVWREKGLPPTDRVLAIGFDDMALKRGILKQTGEVFSYSQRGGIEQTNQWFNEAVDLQSLYSKAWPNDRLGQAEITFVGFAALGGNNLGGMAFSHVGLSR